MFSAALLPASSLVQHQHTARVHILAARAQARRMHTIGSTYTIYAYAYMQIRTRYRQTICQSTINHHHQSIKRPHKAIHGQGEGGEARSQHDSVCIIMFADFFYRTNHLRQLAGAARRRRRTVEQGEESSG